MKGESLPSPSYFNVFIVLAIGLHFALPIKTIVYQPYTYLGVPTIILGLILNVWSVGTLKKKGTSTEFHETAARLVMDGPFRVSRNPIYLSGVILSLGIAVVLGSLITFAFPLLLFLILHRYYIPIEEMRLEETFGREYLEYRQRVRRWI